MKTIQTNKHGIVRDNWAFPKHILANKLEAQMA